MKIIIDTREKGHKHLEKAFEAKGIEYIRRKLEYGDYSFEVDGVSFEKKVSVERKANLTEIAGNICQGRERFKREFERAKADECKMVLLIEQKDVLERIEERIAMDAAGIDMDIRFKKTWRTRCTGNSMDASIKAFEERYDLDLIFCHKLGTAGEILKVFENYLEEEGDD